VEGSTRKVYGRKHAKVLLTFGNVGLCDDHHHAARSPILHDAILLKTRQAPRAPVL